MLTRLILKDILANLGPGAEPETREAIEAVLAQDRPKLPYIPGTHILSPAPAKIAVVAPQPARLVEVNGPQYLSTDDIAARNAHPDPRQHLSQTDVDAINNERKMTWDAQQRLAQGIPFGQATPPSIPQGAGIERVALGGRNRLNEECIQIDAESGCSLFKCANGHAYWGNNPAVRGCTQCHLEGNAVRANEERDDPGRIDGGGYDDNW
jgi:hypothetical protein